MIKLADIKPYVEKMAYITSIVLEMEVLVCDADFSIIGDSEHKGYVCSEVDFLKTDSVVSQAMLWKKPLTYQNAKEENEGCRKCTKREYCTTEAIIAYPMIIDDTVIGGIGIYSQRAYQISKLIHQYDVMIQFIENICDLVTSKMKEQETVVEIKATNARMNQVIEALDFALLSIDENGQLLCCNRKASALMEEFDRKDAVSQLLERCGIDKFCKKNRETRVFLKRKRKCVEYEVTYSPIIVGRNFKGALIYFKEVSQVLVKAGELLGPVKISKFDDIIGESQSIRKVKEDAASFAESSSSVLILGESGTGKEVFANAIHNAGSRVKGPFVAVNCAAIPDNLLESELFGYEEGAFTGAAKGGRVGKFEIANGGTLFLDEIGELPIHLQPKLLRALQDKKIQRVGSNRWIDVDIRIIAATNRDLEKMMQRGEFREDLYYRLCVIPIKIAPLRERREDIPLLADYFLNMYCEMLNKSYVAGFSPETMSFMRNYEWAGNVRELQNAVEYAVNRCKGGEILAEDLPERIVNSQSGSTQPPVPICQLEREAIVNALRYFEGCADCKEKAAKAMGMSRATIYRKIKEYDI